MERLETGNKLLFLPFLKYHHFSFHHINYSCSLVFSLLAWPPCNRAKNKRAILKPLSIQHPPKMMWQRSLSHVDIIQVMSVCSRCFVSLVPDANCWLWRNVAAEWYLKHQLPAIKINMLFRLVDVFFFFFLTELISLIFVFCVEDGWLVLPQLAHHEVQTRPEKKNLITVGTKLALFCI